MPDHAPWDGAVDRVLDSTSGGFWVRSPADTSGGGSETHPAELANVWSIPTLAPMRVPQWSTRLA